MLSKWAEIWFLEVFDDGDSESEFSLNDDFSVHWRVKHVFQRLNEQFNVLSSLELVYSFLAS